MNPILSTIQQSNRLCKLPIIRHVKILSSCKIYDHPLYYSQARDQRTTRRGPRTCTSLFFLSFLPLYPFLFCISPLSSRFNHGIRARNTIYRSYDFRWKFRCKLALIMERNNNAGNKLTRKIFHLCLENNLEIITKEN